MNGAVAIPSIHHHNLLFFNLILLRFFKLLLACFSICIFNVWYFYASHIHLPGDDIGDQEDAEFLQVFNLFFKTLSGIVKPACYPV